MQKTTRLTLRRLHIRNILLQDTRDEHHIEPTWRLRLPLLCIVLFCETNGKPISLYISIKRRFTQRLFVRFPHWFPLPTLLPNDHDPVYAIIAQNPNAQDDWNIHIYGGDGRQIASNYRFINAINAQSWAEETFLYCPIHFTTFACKSTQQAVTPYEVFIAQTAYDDDWEVPFEEHPKDFEDVPIMTPDEHLEQMYSDDAAWKAAQAFADDYEPDDPNTPF